MNNVNELNNLRWGERWHCSGNEKGSEECESEKTEIGVQAVIVSERQTDGSAGQGDRQDRAEGHKVGKMKVSMWEKKQQQNFISYSNMLLYLDLYCPWEPHHSCQTPLWAVGIHFGAGR